MQRKSRTRTKTATALTNAQPEFVSIVRAGANMLPFRAMKSEDKPENTMQLKVKAATHDIARLVFRGENFKDEAAVTAWLTAGGYEGTTVVKGDDDSFSVTDPDAPTEGLVEIETESGVTAFVFQRQAAAAKAAGIAAEEPTPESLPSKIVSADGKNVQPVAAKKEGEEGAPAAAEPNTAVVVVAEGALATPLLETLRVKFDEWGVQYSDELTLTDALADGFDGIPPGFCEVLTAVYAATRNAVIMNQTGSIGQIFADAGAVVAKLAAIFPRDIPFEIDATVFLEEDSPFMQYRVKGEGDAADTLDQARLLGDMLFPAFTVQRAVSEAGEVTFAPATDAAQLLLSVPREKASMDHKRQRIQAKAAAKKAKPNAQQGNDTDGNASDASANGSSNGADAGGNGSSASKETTETGQAAPAVTGDALTAALTAALAPAMAAMTDSIKTALETAQKAGAAQVELVTKASAEAIEAVQAAQIERQTRKSADADETGAGKSTNAQPTKAQQASKSVAEMRMRGALGMPAPRRS